MKLIATILLVTAAFAQTASYPGAVATSATMFKAGNNIKTTLLAAQGASDTVAIVNDSTGIVAPILISVGSSTGTSKPEIEAVCLVSGNTLTIGYNGTCPSTSGRGFDSTAAVAHVATVPVTGNYLAWHRNKDSVEIQAIETALGAGLANISVLPSATALQQFRKNATKTAVEAYADVTLQSTGFVFAPVTCSAAGTCSPGGASGLSLGVGTNVLNFSIVPLGVSGTHTIDGGLPQYLWVSGGTGTNEPCPISGGTGTPLQINGQIIVNCAYSHTGAFTIASAAFGVPEAFYSCSTSCSVVMPAGNLYQHATISIPTTMALHGQGKTATIINVDSGAWDGIHILGLADLSDFSIQYAAGTTYATTKAGWGVSVKNVGVLLPFPSLHRIFVYGFANGVQVYNSVVVLDDVQCRAVSGVGFGVYGGGGTASIVANFINAVGFSSTAGPSIGLQLSGPIPGMQVINSAFDNVETAIQAVYVYGPGYVVSEVQMDNIQLDGYKYGIDLIGSATDTGEPGISGGAGRSWVWLMAQVVMGPILSYPWGILLLPQI